MWLRGIKENRKWKEVSGVDAVCLFWSGLHRSPGHWRLRDAGTGGVDHPPVSHVGEVGGRERAKGPRAGAGPGSAQQGGHERSVPRGNGEATL